MASGHDKVETSVAVLVILTVLVVAVGGLVEIVPLFFQKSTTEPVEGLKPYNALQIEGRDVYVREGCYLCHSQMIRPFQWGSKRTGPDLHRVGGRYSDDWHRVHFMNPRDVVPESIMPGYPWLAKNKLDPGLIQRKMRLFNQFGPGTPYSADEIKNAPADLEGKTEMDALIAYLQGMGTAIKVRR